MRQLSSLKGHVRALNTEPNSIINVEEEIYTKVIISQRLVIMYYLELVSISIYISHVVYSISLAIPFKNLGSTCYLNAACRMLSYAESCLLEEDQIQWDSLRRALHGDTAMLLKELQCSLKKIAHYTQNLNKTG